MNKLILEYIRHSKILINKIGLYDVYIKNTLNKDEDYD